MKIVLNGAEAELRDGATVDDAVAAAGIAGPARGVAVAVEGEVVPRASWEQRSLEAGEIVEVVHAVQGG